MAGRDIGLAGPKPAEDFRIDKKASVAYALQMPTIKRTDEFSNWLRTEMAKAKRSMQTNISTVPR
jgi:hypothetical protein